MKIGGTVKRSADPTATGVTDPAEPRGVMRLVAINQMTARKPSGRPYVLASVLAAIAAAGSAFAQERTPERRLVQAFHTYCIATAAEPGRVEAEIKKVAKLESKGIATYANGGYFEAVEVLDAIGQRDPHQRMLVLFGWGLGDSRRKRTCQVNMPWGEKAKLIDELVGNPTVVGESSAVVQEGRFDTDLTRWTTRIGNTDAVVELGMPTYAGAAGRALTLSLEGQ